MKKKTEFEPQFLTGLRVEYITDKLVRLLSPLKYESKVLDTLIIIPKDYVSDLASVPRVPGIYSLWGNRAHHEALPHDYIYATHKFTKEQADKAFLEAMEVRGKPFWIRWPMYVAVVVGGHAAYKSGPNRYKLNHGGKK